MPGRPMRSLIKISFHEDGKKHERIFDFGPTWTARMAVELACSTFSVPEDWTLAMYSRKHGGWIHDDTPVMNITFKGHKSLDLRTKTPSFFEVLPSLHLDPSKTPLRDSAILKGPTSPLDHHRLFNFMFRTENDQFVARFQKGAIYLSILLFTSDNKLLLSPHGLPPTVLLSDVDLTSCDNFDTESPDFAWMFKTTLDWASETTGSGAGDPDTLQVDNGASNIATPISSPPTSRKSLAVESPRENITDRQTKRFSNGHLSPSNSNNQMVGNGKTSSSISSLASDTKTPSTPYHYVDRKRDCRRENMLRQQFVAAVDQLQRKLAIPPIDLLYDKVMDLPQVGAKSVVAIQYVKDTQRDSIAAELMHMGSFRWRHIESVSSTVYTRKEEIWTRLTSYYDSVRVSKPSPGLYVGLYYTESTMSGLQILVSSQRRPFIPMVKLRDETEILPDEWNWIRSTSAMDMTKLAKHCAVSKEDPLHHLKVEFARSSTMLSKLTMLHWDPSDLYTHDTMKVVVQKSEEGSLPAPPPAASSSAAPSPQSERVQPRWSTQGIDQSLAAMDSDPVWKEHPELNRSRPSSTLSTSSSTTDNATTILTGTATFRVILFIKPTRHANQPHENFNRRLFELCPFSIFDAIHHSVYNTMTYHFLRRTMHTLTHEIEELEIELEKEHGQEPRQLQLAHQLQLGLESGRQRKDSHQSNHSNGSRSSLHRHFGSLAGDSSDEGEDGAESEGKSMEKGCGKGDKLLESQAEKRSRTFSRTVDDLGIKSGDGFLTMASLSQHRASFLGDAAIHHFSTGPESPGAVLAMDNSKVVEGGIVTKRGSRLSFPGQDSGTGAGVTLSPGTSPKSQLQLQQQHPAYPQRLDSRPLPPLPLHPLPGHRRSQSQFSTSDSSGDTTARSGGGVSSSLAKPRSRTTSHSSPISHQLHQNNLLRNNRSLVTFGSVGMNGNVAGDGESHSASSSQHGSPKSQHQHFHQHQHRRQYHHPNHPNYSNFPHSPDLARLEKEQQKLQDHWRSVSWTRQLNEWDHARTLKVQEQLLGIVTSPPLSSSSSLTVVAPSPQVQQQQQQPLSVSSASASLSAASLSLSTSGSMTSNGGGNAGLLPSSM